MDEAEVTERVSLEMEQTAIQRARIRSRAARWDIDVAVFFFAVLALVIMLLFARIAIEVVAPVAIFGLAIGWLMGWRKGQQLYRIFYDEELANLMRELLEEKEKKVEETMDETIEEKVQKALYKRLQY